MDSLTQITLGAAVGEAVLGREVGGKAAAWGAVAGVLPDLDVLATPFVTEVQALAIHRGFSHSITFVVLAAPLLGWLAHRIHRDAPPSWHGWGWLFFWALSTHVLLDCFTTYGTQVFQPFRNDPVSFSSIFIIDPLYTFPLAAGLLTALFTSRTMPRRRRANVLGLGLSTLYLLVTLFDKQMAESAFTAALHEQRISYDRLLTRPGPFNNLLWMGLADAGDTLHVGVYSLLDDEAAIRFRSIPKHADRIAPFQHQLPVERLRWFSRGYYTVTREQGDLVFHDLRFGRSDFWLTDEGDYLFSFRLAVAPDDPDRVVGFERMPSSLRVDQIPWKRLGQRMLGGE